MQARRIDKHDLAFRPVDDALDAMPRGLWLVRDDADLAAHQRVHQRTFADVGPTDDGDEAATHKRSPALAAAPQRPQQPPRISFRKRTAPAGRDDRQRSDEHTTELQSLMRN